MTQNPQTLYKILLEKFGHQNWWPIDKQYHKKNKSDPRLEIIIGAILTQNTAWSNVEKALDNLKSKNMLETKKISDADIRVLKKLIKPSGFFNQKSHRLKNMARHLHENYNDNLDLFFDRNMKDIRDELLSMNGIGPETADSIILYAGDLPIFVVDAYTKRLCKRLPLKTGSSYDEIQDYFQEKIKKHYKENEITRVYNELHALIVVLAKNYCKKKPDCKNCPIRKNCEYQK